MPDYIPNSDAEFNIWQANLVEKVLANATAWGIPAEDIAIITAKQTVWTSCFSKASNKQNRTSADVQAKDDAREPYEKDLRKFVAQWLAHNTKVSNSDRERMGVTVKSTTHTPKPTPTTCPVGTIDFSVRMQHGIHYADEATPRSKAKPDGIHGCEVWMKLDGEAPKDSSELTFLATNTSSPYVATFDGSQVGKTAWYRLRWVNTRGEHGPWSSIISAIVVG
jgi:hypothetical protein